MNTSELKQALEKKFNQPIGTGARRHIVFWYDEEKTFRPMLDDIVPASVVLRVLEDNFFSTKHFIEEENTGDNILIYSPAARPSKEEDWLYDTYKYSIEFSADTATLIMNELGLDRGDIKGFLKANRKFFDNQERFDRLKELCSPDWTIEDLQIGMMAVGCRIRHSSLEEVLKALFKNGLDEEENKAWQAVAKWPGEDAFFRLVEKAYGYSREKPSLKTLLISLMVSDMSLTTTLGLPPTLEQYKTPVRNNCRIFVNHWINHSVDQEDYEKLAASIAADINLKGFLSEQPVETYAECETFEDMDRHIIVHIAGALSEGLQDYERI